MKSAICRKAKAMFLDNNNGQVLAELPLCEVCNALNLVQMFREGVRESHPITLGALATILSKQHSCGLCGLVSHLISRSWLLDRHPGEDLTSVQVQLVVVPSGFADASDVVPRIACAHRIFVRAARPLAIQRMVTWENLNLTMDLQMMEDDAARFGRNRAYHGRKVGPLVNFKLIKEWRRICEEVHGPTCANVWKNVIEELPQGAKMIDVIKMAIVEAPQNCSYVALSYMWGKMNTDYKTVKKNVAKRCRRYSLEKLALPRTICDTFKVVRKLKIRYLWIDAMCIIPDDPDHQKTQIAGMATIYGAAVLTIFSVGGDSANAPLPGLKPGSRQELQQIERIQSLSLAVPLRLLGETVTMSSWNTRGWTFQELILSRRGLFFTNEQLFFKCQRDVFSEDLIAESSTDHAMYPGKFHGLGAGALHPIRNIRYEHTRYNHYAHAFMRIVEEYTRRELTDPTDIYNAISAIITIFSRDLEIAPLDPDLAFLFGMPLSVLEDAMLWQPSQNARAHDRRQLAMWSGERLVTPSWSWSGWKNSVVYFSLDGFINGPLGALRSLVDEWVIVDKFGQPRGIPAGRHLLANYQRDEIHLSNPPGASLIEEGRSFEPGTLLFYTTVALLHIQKVDYEFDNRRNVGPTYFSKFHSVFEVLSETSRPAKIGRIVLPNDTNTMVPHEFAVLSRSDTSPLETYDEQLFGNRTEGCLLNVMAVKQVDMTVDGKEVSERVGVGLIVEVGWLAARFRKRVVRLQ